MAHYIVIGNFTEQGIRNIKQTNERVEGIRKVASKFSVTIKDFYWTVGQYDTAVILEAPDDEAVSQLMLTIGAAGNVRTQTMRAFTESEMQNLTSKL